ncbi:MAG TPA: vitamin B12-dependent ribonucleotide reductase [Solirubrobacteraceae bacterium]|nr:vitamin B12-dependent ribonucleotide reductase [Solirubrobacteraceae bacterium]
MEQTPQTQLAPEVRTGEGLSVKRFFTTPGVHPFDSVEWELRKARIGHGDKVSFEQSDVEFPKSWSQNATNIVAQKYFRGQLGAPTREHSVQQMIGRVAGTIADWGRDGGYFASEADADTFEAELTHILLHQMAAFNSPVWFNVGFEETPQCSACFILSVDDTMESILEWNTKEGMIFRGGSGSGINLSRIRGSMESLAKGGTASGPVSFMRGADAWAGTIKSGGKTRRAAKMVVLDIDHPDVEEFIWCKAKEERKARVLEQAGYDMTLDSGDWASIQYQNANNSARVTDAFMEAVEADGDWNLTARTDGSIVETVKARELLHQIAAAAWRCADPGVQYDTTINSWHTLPNTGRINASNPCSEYMSIDGEGFFSIQYQNANNSVRVTERFMQAVENDEDWQLIGRVTGTPIGEPIPARQLMQEIAEAAWRCADPGIQYDTTINQWHTCPNSGRINASNPCSEYMHVDDSACNLASLNLMKFRRPDGTFNVESFEHAVDVMFLAQEIIVSPSSYPTEEIGANARAFRQLGMGYANLGAYLMANGVPYDSDAGRGTAAAITALMTGRAYLGSARTAAAMSPYDRYAENRDAHNAVMKMHRDASYAIPGSACADTELLAAARRTWEETVALGERVGYRNAQATVLAPTGTISFLMDCDTTGIEPDFSLVKFKELVGGGHMTIVNKTVPLALQTLGYNDEQIEQIVAYINEHGTIIDAPELAEEHLQVFDVAVGERAISHMGHLKMMGATQPFISGAISKTVNMPQTATVEDIADAYVEAWRLGIKALAIYRDGSKTAQALRTEAQKDASETKEAEIQKAVAEALAKAPVRRRMPRERHSITHKFSIGGHEGYITAGMYDDGTVGEIFLTDIGKEGSTLRGMMNSFATAISIALQTGVPLETLVRKFSYMRFEPEGMTSNPEIPFAKSMPDYIMRWLASRFLDVDLQEELGILTPAVRARQAAQEAASSHIGDVAAPPAEVQKPGNGNGQSSHPAPPALPAASALTDSPPVIPAMRRGLDLGPACQQCGGMMQRTGSCYTCSSCGFNTGCG